MLNKIKQKVNDLSISKRLKDEEERKVFLKELGCIDIGIIVGIVTYVICLYTHFDIYGWNFGLVLSPLFAGYAESLAAKRYLEESTGAISAFILFLITVIYRCNQCIYSFLNYSYLWIHHSKPNFRIQCHYSRKHSHNPSSCISYCCELFPYRNNFSYYLPRYRCLQEDYTFPMEYI